MSRKDKPASMPDPLQPGRIAGKNSATPERIGHTRVHGAVEKKKTAEEADEQLDDALEQTFPASDPISQESTLVPGGRR
jgi:hypothetical protein